MIPHSLSTALSFITAWSHRTLWVKRVNRSMTDPTSTNIFSALWKWTFLEKIYLNENFNAPIWFWRKKKDSLLVGLYGDLKVWSLSTYISWQIKQFFIIFLIATGVEIQWFSERKGKSALNIFLIRFCLLIRFKQIRVPRQKVTSNHHLSPLSYKSKDLVKFSERTWTMTYQS